MKKLALVLIAAMMLTTLLAVGVSAAGITIPNKDVTYVASKVTDTIKTYEAVVQLDKSVTGRAGVIIGNYQGGTPCVSFEIHNNGNVRMYAVADGKNNLDIIFKEVDIRSDKPVHIAVVFDTAKKQAHCYLDGVLKQSLDYTAKGYVLQGTGIPLWIGGDKRSGNAQYFKGEIFSAAAYSDERSADTIKKDAAALNTTDASVLFAYDFTVGGKARLQDLSKNDNDLVYTGPEVPEPETTKAPAATTAVTQKPASTGSSAATADIAVILSAVTAIAASGVVVLKKKH